MDKKVSLRGLGSHDLITRFARLLAHERRTTAELLRAMELIDRRKLWAAAGYPSMFAFCVERYRMSEAIANKRIRAARAAGRFPLLLELIGSGEIHLTGVAQLAKHLTEENHREVLARARHRTMREIEEIVAELAPQPERASRLAALPRRSAPVVAAQMAPAGSVGDRRGLMPAGGVASTLEEAVDTRAAAASGSPGQSVANAGACGVPHERACETSSAIAFPMFVSAEPAAAAVGRAADPSPMSPGRYRLSVTLSQEGRDRLRELQEVLAHQVPDGDPAVIVEKALVALLEQSLKRKAAQTDRPRATSRPSSKPMSQRAGTTSRPSSKPSAQRSRAIPAEVRRTVWERDGGRCAFVSPSGRRCTAKHRIEFHHKVPWARGGAHTVANIELRCQAHNALHAERDYGEAFMRERRKKPRVEEGRVVYQADPGGRAASRSALLVFRRERVGWSVAPP